MVLGGLQHLLQSWFKRPRPIQQINHQRMRKTNLTPVHYPISRRSKYLQEWTIKRVIQNTHILFLLLYVTFYFYVILFCNFFQSRSVVYAVYLIIFSCNMLSTPLIQTILYVPFILWSELIQCYRQDRSSTKVRPLISTKFTLF